MQLRATLFICWLTTAWLASWVAVATLRLNADQAWSSHDRITLLLILAILYGLLLSLYGVTLGTAAGIVRRRWPSDAVRQHADRLQTAAAWTPFIYISLMLPDIMMIGEAWPPSKRRVSTVKPLRRGITTSSRIRSGESRSARISPSTPSRATSTA